jgi:hypothetical protein
VVTARFFEASARLKPIMSRAPPGSKSARLIDQADFLRPLSLRLFQNAGLTGGMAVLDVEGVEPAQTFNPNTYANYCLSSVLSFD